MEKIQKTTYINTYRYFLTTKKKYKNAMAMQKGKKQIYFASFHYLENVDYLLVRKIHFESSFFGSRIIRGLNLISGEDVSLPMSNEACSVLFKWLLVGTTRHDEWLLLCPEGRLLFARRTKGGHRGYGSVGTWTHCGDVIYLRAFACCQGAKLHNLEFKRNCNKVGLWVSTEGAVTRELRLVGWSAVPDQPMLRIADAERPEPALLAICDNTEEVVEHDWTLV